VAEVAYLHSLAIQGQHSNRSSTRELRYLSEQSSVLRAQPGGDISIGL
jgi:hypothetical protein